MLPFLSDAPLKLEETVATTTRAEQDVGIFCIVPGCPRLLPTCYSTQDRSLPPTESKPPGSLSAAGSPPGGEPWTCSSSSPPSSLASLLRQRASPERGSASVRNQNEPRNSKLTLSENVNSPCRRLFGRCRLLADNCLSLTRGNVECYLAGKQR